MTYNIGIIIGPILGGILSDLAGTYPEQFGSVEFFRRYPYAAPNLLSAFFLLSAMTSTWLCLDEVSDTRSEFLKRHASRQDSCCTLPLAGGGS